MSLTIKLFLTATAGLGIFALVNWVAMSEEDGMERYRRILLVLLSIQLSLLTTWWVSHKLEDHLGSFENPNGLAVRRWLRKYQET